MFLLALSGLGIAILLRIYEFNGYVIATLGLLIEALAMLMCYFLFRNYLKTESEEPPAEMKKTKKSIS